MHMMRGGLRAQEPWLYDLMHRFPADAPPSQTIEPPRDLSVYQRLSSRIIKDVPSLNTPVRRVTRQRKLLARCFHRAIAHITALKPIRRSRRPQRSWSSRVRASGKRTPTPLSWRSSKRAKTKKANDEVLLGKWCGACVRVHAACQRVRVACLLQAGSAGGVAAGGNVWEASLDAALNITPLRAPRLRVRALMEPPASDAACDADARVYRPPWKTPPMTDGQCRDRAVDVLCITINV